MKRQRGSTFSKEPRRDWARHLLRCVVLALTVLIVYSNSFQSGFVLDNQFIIKLDPRNKEASLENLKQLWQKDYWWPKTSTGAYRPLVSTSYLVNWSVLGNGKHQNESDQVIGFHWVNVIAHGTNTVLTYFLMLKLLRRPWIAFFTAALFAVHPIATESVTNIVGRADEFAAMIFLGCTLLYIRSTESSGLRRLPWLLGLITLFAAGCFGKESVLSFLAVPIVFDGIYRWGSESYRNHRAKWILFDWLCYLVLALPVLGLLWVRSIVFRDAPAVRWLFLDNPISKFEWSDSNSVALNIQNWIIRFMTAANVAAKALWKLVWPAHLSADYSYDQIELFGWQLTRVEDIKAILALLFVAGTLLLAAACFKRHKPVSFLIALYWIAYGPTSNFLVTTSSIFAERFLYLPLVAFCALFVIGVDKLAGRIGTGVEFDRKSLKRPWPQLLPQALLLLMVICFGVRTYVRNFDWRNDVTLAESTLKHAPHSFRSYGKLAEVYYQQDPVNQIDRVIELAETGVSIIDPLPDKDNASMSYQTLGIYYGLKGERAATRTATGLLTMNDQTREWFEKSAQILERGSEIDLAENEANRARELARGKGGPPDVGPPELYRYLGMAYSRLGMDRKALEAFEYMRHLDPRNPAAYTRIATTQVALGQLDEAAVTFTQCIILDGKNADAWQWLADIYSEINREPIPALEIYDGRPELRKDNALVQRHLLQAFSGFIKIARSSRRSEMLNEVVDTAVTLYRLTPSALDNAQNEEVARPMPPTPVFHTYGKKLVEESPGAKRWRSPRADR